MRRSEALALFGTEEPVPERRLLTAGPLAAILEDGNLRTISFGGVEVVRSINYLARDSSWGTYKAELSNMIIEEGEGAFSVAYDGLCAGPDGCYAYRIMIRGEASGRLAMKAIGEALTDFPTNRTGFVVLHPSEAAGGRLTIRHSDGQVEETVFPEAISPDQPAFDIAALTHEPAAGLTCTVEMEGDAFEMEDQRNWADASFKTYIRPLSKPRPYIIAKGENDVQRITVTVDGRPPPVRTPVSAGGARLMLGEPKGRMPGLSLFLDSNEPLDGAPSTLLRGAAGQVIMRFDATISGSDALGMAADFARAIGAKLAVEAIFDARDPAGEAAAVTGALRAASIDPAALLVSLRREFKTRRSNSLPDKEVGIAALVNAVRATGIKARIGAGTPSLFTEFNRNPPAGDYEFAFFSVASNVHASDDASVMETLSVYPAIVSSARKLCVDKPIWLGPCTIGIRHNPYGADVADNPEGRRKPGARIDPRHGALFGAAFAAGVAAAAVNAGVDHVILAALTGPFGLLDGQFRPRPISALHDLLAHAAGADRCDLAVDHPGVTAFGFYEGAALRVAVANVSFEEIDMRLPRQPVTASIIGDGGELAPVTVKAQVLQLSPYRTVLLRF